MSDALFLSKAPWIMHGLIKEFGISDIQAAAVVGNIGHECAGFTQMQEGKPIGGGRGGYGWCQWTGTRRTQFEQYAQKLGLSVDDDKANYGFLVWELHNTEKGAISSLRAASDIEGSVRAFEQHFERANPKYKHYDRRIRYAKIALDAYGSHHFAIAEAVLSVSAIPASPAEGATRETATTAASSTASLGAVLPTSSAFRSKLVATAKSELKTYGSYLEQDSPLRERIGVYWAFLDRPDLDGSDHSVPWSAAFISYMVKLAGAGPAFSYSTQHSVYFYRAINDRVTKKKTPFQGFEPEDIEIGPGDIVGMNRNGAALIDYDWAAHNADYKSHSDIVIAVDEHGIHTIGGNVGHTPGQVAQKTFAFSEGRWVNTAPGSNQTIFAVIRSFLP